MAEAVGVLAVIVPADACGNCPDTSRPIAYQVAAVPAPCALTVTAGEQVVTYTARCGVPEFHEVRACEEKPAERSR